MEVAQRVSVDISFGTALKLGVGVALGTIVVMLVPWIILAIIVLLAGTGG